ncbi:Pnap_2097 family protein [Marinomonas sp.]
MATDLIDATSVEQDYLIGMPQLALGGISENWLLKECGHQHWLALAKSLNLPVPSFVDEHNRKLYAAFLVVRVSNAVLHRVTENSRLSIATQLKRVSPSRSYSRHDLCLEEEGLSKQVIAQVELLSSFVSRHEEGNNQSVARNEMLKGGWSACEPASQMMAEHKKGRNLPNAEVTSISKVPFVYQPCPYADFNGADFLYFAQFQVVMDRAERFFQAGLQAFNADPSSSPSPNKPLVLWQVVERTICYYGNINLDDALAAHLYTILPSDHRKSLLGHCGRLYRQSDNALIANVITKKRYMDHPLVSFKKNEEVVLAGVEL